MTQLLSYEATKAVFATARKPAAGKPLGSKWRLFKDGDEFVLNVEGSQIARILPDNTLRFTTSVPSSSAVMGVYKVLPVMFHRRSKDHYRVHVRRSGGNHTYLSSYDLTSWKDRGTKGHRLYDGLTVSLPDRKVVDYKEPTREVDVDARKEWLRKSKALKTYLKTIAKLGGFVAAYDQLVAHTKEQDMFRWEYGSLFSLTEGEEDLATIISALNGGDTRLLVQRVGESMYRNFYHQPSTTEQLQHIDSIFASNSLVLRKALGVITELKG